MNLEQQCNAIVRQATKRQKRFRLPINPDFYRMVTLERLLKAKAYQTFSIPHRAAIWRDYIAIYRKLYGCS